MKSSGASEARPSAQHARREFPIVETGMFMTREVRPYVTRLHMKYFHSNTHMKYFHSNTV
jgi:hypothetical protein